MTDAYGSDDFLGVGKLTATLRELEMERSFHLEVRPPTVLSQR
jgi:hypothetical protein